VPREVKSQPTAEKKAPGKKPGLGAPPSGPPSTVDSYERQLLSIPEFANFGKLFKVLSLNLRTKFYILFFLYPM
jgi:coatomer protein complex subunit gamma